MYIAMNAIAKYAQPLFKPLEGAAYEFGTRLRANNAAIGALRARADTLAGTRDLATARKYVAEERAWLEQRSEVLAEIEKANPTGAAGTDWVESAATNPLAPTVTPCLARNSRSRSTARTRRFCAAFSLAPSACPTSRRDLFSK